MKNAQKFTQQGSIKIKASYKEALKCIVVHVEDTGAGIAPEDFSHLFSRFGKLHRTAEINNEGIGLGLTIVKQIVETSGGFIDVKSEGVGKGSLFFFTMKMQAVVENENTSESDENLF